MILTPSYLLIGKVDRWSESRVETHLVINSPCKTKTHFMDQCPLTFLSSLVCTCLCLTVICLPLLCCIAPFPTYVSSNAQSKQGQKEKESRVVSDGQNQPWHFFHDPVWTHAVLNLPFLKAEWLTAKQNYTKLWIWKYSFHYTIASIE